MEKYKVCIFSGGRGASTIISELVQFEHLELTVLLNAYDDGLSTGYLRKLVPGMLGPSDIRKTFTTILKSSNSAPNITLAEMLEYRIGSEDSRGHSWNIPENDRENSKFLGGESFLSYYFDELPMRVARKLDRWLGIAIDYLIGLEVEQGLKVSFLDLSLGNLFFVGTYLDSNRNFNKAIEAWSESFLVGANILNITEGDNRVLVGLKEDGSILVSEAAIVSQHATDSKLFRVFLLKDYLPDSLIRKLADSSFDEIQKFFDQVESLPNINSEALNSIRQAQMIVYGPGTQHSSLLPSYLTLGLSDTIAENRTAKKVFISNVGFDYDIVGYDFDTLIDRVVSYMKIGSKQKNPTFSINDLITHSIVSASSDLKLSSNPSLNSRNPNFEISMAKWNQDKYSHDGKKVAHGLVTIASLDSTLFENESLNSLSIIVPVLDEIRTVEKVLNEILTFDWLSEGFAAQIIVVDGGSMDGTWEVVHKLAGVQAIQDPTKRGRGSAIRLGISHAKGDLLITFPADGEYSVDAILDIARVLSQKNLDIVFGSRSTMCSNTDDRLRQIYGGNSREYYLSKWGGFALSSLAALKFRRWISDPLTSVKGFRNIEQVGLSLRGNSLDWDTQIIVDSWKLGKSIVEVPVDYAPRTARQGKKTTVLKGLKALWKLLQAQD